MTSDNAKVPSGLSDVARIAAEAIIRWQCFGMVDWFFGATIRFPRRMLRPICKVVQVVAGYSFTAAVKPDGTTVVFGLDDPAVKSVPKGLTNTVLLAAGYFHLLAVQGDQTVTPTVWMMRLNVRCIRIHSCRIPTATDSRTESRCDWGLHRR